MRVSVIIPVYNAERYLRRAVVSVLIQVEVIELLLVEDGSLDNSLGLCHELAEKDKRIIVLQHFDNKNRGVAASRNLGIRNSRCPFVAFLDADDYYLPNRFKHAVECINNDKTIDGVYEMIGICNNHANEIKPYSLIERVPPDQLFENLQPIGSKVWFSIDGLTVKKSVFDKAGFFDETLRTSEDTLQWFKMAATVKLVAGDIKSPVSLTESRKDSLTADRKLVERDFIRMLFKLFEFCGRRHSTIVRKELVLSNLFFYSSLHPYKYDYSAYNKIALLFKIVLLDPRFVIFHSRCFRRQVGNMLGYNHFLSFFKS